MATFHENLVQSFHNFRDKYLKANSNFFKFSYDTTTKKYGFTINGTFHPFAPSDTKDDTISYTSNDNSSIFNSGNLGGQSTYAWTAVSKIATGEKHSSLLNKVSTMFKNVRTIAKLIGTTNISSIGNGTLSGGISELNNDLAKITDGFEVSISANTTFSGAIQAIKASPSYDATKFTSYSTITIGNNVYHRSINNEFCSTLFYGSAAVYIIAFMLDNNTANQCTINAAGNTFADVSSTQLAAQTVKIKY